MRITGGRSPWQEACRSFRNMHTRPTSDRVREAVMSILVARDLIDGAIVLDAFSGTGAFGFENAFPRQRARKRWWIMIVWR